MLRDPEGAVQRPMVRNFIEFLYIFGHFVRIFALLLIPRACLQGLVRIGW